MKPSFGFLSFVILSIAICQPATAQWVPTNGPYGGNVYCLTTALAHDGSGDTVLFAGGPGGVFSSSDRGGQWTRRMVGLDRAYPSTWKIAATNASVLAGTSGGLFRSTDDGQSWIDVSSACPYPSANVLCAHGAEYMIGTTYGICRSTDDGGHWIDFTYDLPVTYVISIAVDGTSVFVGTSSGVYRLNAGDTTWTAAIGGLPYYGDIYVHAILPHHGKLFAATESGVYVSTDHGTNWTASNTGLTYAFPYTLIAHGSSLLVGDEGNGIFRSGDDGDHWSQVNNGLTDSRVTCLMEIGSQLFAGTTAAGMYRSDDGGNNWVGINSGLTNTHCMAFAVPPGVNAASSLFAATYNGVLHSTDNGASWTRANQGLSDSSVFSLFFSGTTLLAGANGNIFRSTDQGASWSLTQTWPTQRLIRGFSALPGSAGTSIFAATDGNGIFRSTDDGLNWTDVDNGMTYKYFDAVAVSDSNVFLGGGRGAHRSTDGGETWAEVDSGMMIDQYHPYVVTSLGVLPRNGSDKIYAGVYLGGVFLSTNKGVSWRQINYGFAAGLEITSLVFVDTVAFAATNGYGVWRLTNHETEWVEVNTGLEYGDINALLVSGSYMYAGVSGGGVWRRPVSDMVTGVKALETSTTPLAYGLRQNYPNPCNPRTNISYTIASSKAPGERGKGGRGEWVRLGVYDLLGREVAVVVDGEQAPGSYTVTFDARNLSSGVYFYRLNAGGTSLVKRMVVLK